MATEKEVREYLEKRNVFTMKYYKWMVDNWFPIGWKEYCQKRNIDPKLEV